MWCIPTVNEQFIDRMEHLIKLYAKPYNLDEPVICFDEKSKQLLDDTRPPIIPRPQQVRKRDYEYQRNGTVNIFLAVEPKGGYRDVVVTDRRTKRDFAQAIKRIAELPRYQFAKQIHIVLDNLNTHFASSLQETFEPLVVKSLLERIAFHYTPPHGSWLNMAETELSILGRQCINQRIPTKEKLREAINVWNDRRNRAHATIQWRFTKKDAKNVFREYYDKLEK